MAKGFQKPIRDMRKPTSGKTKPPAAQASPYGAGKAAAKPVTKKGDDKKGK